MNVWQATFKVLPLLRLSILIGKPGDAGRDQRTKRFARFGDLQLRWDHILVPVELKRVYCETQGQVGVAAYQQALARFLTFRPATLPICSKAHRKLDVSDIQLLRYDPKALPGIEPGSSTNKAIVYER